jgi:cullin 1
MDTKQYMELYNAVHSLCTTQKGVDSDFTQGFSLSNRGGGLIFAPSDMSLISDNHRIAYLCGKELYERLKQLLETHLREIQNKAKQYSNEALLQFCKEERDQYTTAAKHNNHLFRFLNRHWVKQEIEKGNKYIYDVYTLHLVLWKELVVADTYTNVVDAASQ